MVINKSVGLKKVKVDIGPFLDPPAENVFITFSGPTVGEYNDLMAGQMAMAKEDPNGIEVEVQPEQGSTAPSRKVKVSTDSAKKRADLFNGLIAKHVFDHNLEKVEGQKMTSDEVWQFILGNVDMNSAIVEAYAGALPLPKPPGSKPA